MRRLLAIFWYYFSWQRTMAYCTISGVLMIGAGLLLHGGSSGAKLLGSLLVGVGTMCASGFPILLAGIAFRQIVGNRRLAMLPRFRSFAVAALALLSVAGAGMTLVFVYAIPTPLSVDDPYALGLLAFAAISAYLLASQWLVVRPLGLVLFAFVPIVLLRLGFGGAPIFEAWHDNPWPVALLAVCGWVWLLNAVRMRADLRGLAAPAWGSEIGPKSIRGGLWRMPQIGPPATSAGTLVLGAGDGWLSRIATELMSVLTLPVLLMLAFYVLRMPIGEPQGRGLGPAFFLMLSFFGVSMSSLLAFAEWPARMRYLWLRSAGDRGAHWRSLERTLLVEALIVAAITTLVASTLRLFTNFPAELLVLYVTGCIVATFAVAYFGFWSRISGWGDMPRVLCMVVLAFLALGVVVPLANGASRSTVFWLLPIVGVIGLGFRALARRGFAKMDWCAVRPVRRTRAARGRSKF